MFRLWRKGIRITKLQGTTYVVLNFGTFVCSNCAGIHREFNYKVKGLGVSNFTEKEVNFLQENGNLVSNC